MTLWRLQTSMDDYRRLSTTAVSLSPIYHNEPTIYHAPLRLGTTEVYIRTRLRFTSIRFQNSEPFTTTENVLKTCAETTADQELFRTGEVGGRQRCSYGLDVSKLAQRKKRLRRYWVRPLLERRPLLRQYSRSSMARTPMARLPWLIRTRFWAPTKFFRYLKKTNISGIFFYFIMKLYVLCTH